MKDLAHMSHETNPAAMKNEGKPALVPKLRFPEFRGTKEWDNAILGNLSEVVRGGSPRPIDGFLTIATDGLNWLKIGDVDKDAKYVTQTAEKVRPEAISKTRVVNPGDLILSNSMSFGRPYILQIETCIHDGWIAITKIAKEAERDFLYYSISAPNSQSYFVNNAAGSGVQNLNADIIKALPVCFPPLPEQQKIADCLSSVDELMVAQAQKLEALKTHKKGLMQQLFPREGETQPRLRFPEFRDAGKWEAKLLGELGEIITGKTPSTKEADLWGGDILFITPTDISEDSKYQYTAARTVVETKSTKVLPEGSIVYTCIASIGKMALTVRPSITNQQINAVVPNKRALGEFLYYVLANLTPWIKTIPATNTLPIISKTDFSKIAILHPGKAEQQRIADCLSSLDALITAETQKLETLKTHKRGLMQQLFPVLDEVQG